MAIKLYILFHNSIKKCQGEKLFSYKSDFNISAHSTKYSIYQTDKLNCGKDS